MFSNEFWMMMNHPSESPSNWSRIQDKLFEGALVAFPEETPNRWEKIAGQVPGKSAREVRQHYEDLVHDVGEIDSGRVELPSYHEDDQLGWGTSQLSFETNKARNETDRKKGVPWTEEEHRLFLIGLQRYGKGDWRSISRNAVVTRTPTQVASHAQKYFLRLNSVKKEKKRSSIHDITTVENNVMAQPNGSDWEAQSTALKQSMPGPTGLPRPLGDRGSSLGYQWSEFTM